MSHVIAGIGSRNTPPSILYEMKKIGQWCRKLHVWVRSGHAPGADQAFEAGAQEYCIAYLPWPSFERHAINDVVRYILPETWEHLFDHARQFHPKFDALGGSVQKLIARNSAQVLGLNLLSPVKAVICWTRDGGPSGGTGQAIRIAKANRIPVFNMNSDQYFSAELVCEALEYLGF